MKATPSIFRDPPHACPPGGDWMAGGSTNPDAGEAYGFTECQLVGAAMAAYVGAFVDALDGVSRAELRGALVGRFVDELERLGR